MRIDHHSGRSAIAALTLAGALGAGCATTREKPAAWPPPPEKARVVHVRFFRTPDDLDPGFGRKLLDALLPRDSSAAVQSPVALALSPDERYLYVGGGITTRFVRVDLKNRTMSRFVRSSDQAPSSVFGIATDAEGNVYASDWRGSIVLVYDKEGRFLRKIGQGKVEVPTGIAVDRRGQQLYVVCGGTSQNVDHRIEVFSLKGQHLRTMGKRGEAPGEFNFPGGIVVRPDGTLWVADKLNFRIQVFDSTGNLVEQFGEIGRGMAGTFDKIRGLSFDTFGNIYIVDTMQGVHILNPKHQPLMLFAQPGFTGSPNAVLVDSKNRIFVSDYGSNGIHEFQLVNTTAADSYAPADTPSAGSPATPKPSAAPAPRPTPTPSAAPAPQPGGSAVPRPAPAP